MNKKYVLMLSVILAFTISISSISAYLIDFDRIVNTFVVGEIVTNVKADFVLKEHEAIFNNNGSYTLSEEEVYSNSYNVFPGVDIPKDPFVEVKGLSKEAYLYVEIVGSNNDNFSWSVNDNWLKTNLIGSKGGEVYVYKGNSDSAKALDTESGLDFRSYILSGIDESPNGGIEVSKYFNTETLGLDFYGYLIEKVDDSDYLDAFSSSIK